MSRKNLTCRIDSNTKKPKSPLYQSFNYTYRYYFLMDFLESDNLMQQVLEDHVIVKKGMIRSV